MNQIFKISLLEELVRFCIKHKVIQKENFISY